MSATGAHVYKLGGPALEDPGLMGPLADEVRRVKRFAAEWAQDINLRLLEEEEVDLNL